MSYPRLRAFLFAGLFIFGALSPALVFAAAADAAPYLALHTGSPWVAMALSALGTPPDTGFLKSATSTDAIGLEAPMLALTAAGQDPRTYAASDLVEGLESFYTGGQLGDPTTLNDDIFGVLALISAGVSPQDATVAGTRAFIEAHQNADGGWPFMVDSTSDTNTTAAAIMALVASGSSCGDAHITQALAYLHGAQNVDGGFPYDPKSSWGTDSDASSDSWVIMALDACGTDPSAWATASSTPLGDLASYQTPGGYFEFQHGSGEDTFSPVTTSYAVLALLGKTLPLATLQLPPPPPPAPSAPAPSGGGGGGGPVGGPMGYGFDVSATSSLPVASTTPGLVLGTSTEEVASTTAPAAPSDATTTPAAPAYVFVSNVHYGMYDAAVAELQKKLMVHGMLGIVAPTGWFGPLTLEAVKKFQAQNEIPATGFVGSLTRASLNVWQ